MSHLIAAVFKGKCYKNKELKTNLRLRQYLIGFQARIWQEYVACKILVHNLSIFHINEKKAHHHHH